MKIFTIVFCICMIFISSAISAMGATSICKLPKGCQYLDSEFSTGGGKGHSYVMEVTCKMDNGKIIKYLDWELSIGNMLNIGRFTAPRKIEFTKGNKDKLDCDFK